MKNWSAFRFNKHLREKTFHSHKASQLFLVTRGFLQIHTISSCWAIPQGRIVWIAPEVPHLAKSSDLVEGWSAYFDQSKQSIRPDICVLKSSMFLKLLLERMADSRKLHLGVHVDRALATLISHELTITEAENLELLLPQTNGLKKVAQSIIAHGPQGKRVGVWAKIAKMSERSFARHFRAETGMSFEKWRLLALHHKALEMLSSGSDVTSTAIDLGYESVSAFIASFKKVMGTTPGQFLSNIV